MKTIGVSGTFGVQAGEDVSMVSSIQLSEDDLDAATRTVWGEARGESELGKIAVSWVIRTRSTWKPPQWWGSTVRQVCTSAGQFSCWNSTDPNRPKLLALHTSDPEYLSIASIVKGVFNGDFADPTNGATHYVAGNERPFWAVGESPVAVIGHQAFYRIGPSSGHPTPIASRNEVPPPLPLIPTSSPPPPAQTQSFWQMIVGIIHALLGSGDK